MMATSYTAPESASTPRLNDHGPRLQEALWLLMVLVTPLFVNFWGEQQFEASKVWLLQTLIWVAALLWLHGWLTNIQIRALAPAVRHLIIALSLVLLLATYLSPNSYVAIFGTLDRAHGVLAQLSYLLLFVCIATQINLQQSRLLLHAAIVTALPLCLLGLAQAAGWQLLPVFTDARSPMVTTLGRANFTGAYLALLLPLTLVAAQSAQTMWRRGAYGSLLLLILVVIGLTQARAAWVAAVVGLGVLVWLQTAPRWPWRLRWLSVLGTGTLAGGAFLLVLQRGMAQGDSIAARWTIWQASLRLLWPHLWVGYGADTLDLYFPSVYPPQLVYYQGRGIVVDRAHNWLLDWSLNYGVVATLLFTGLVFLVLRQGWKHLMTGQDINGRWSNVQAHENRWLAACMASICAHLVGNLFLFDVAATALLFWLLLAIVVAATATGGRQTVRLPLPPWSRHAILVLGIVVLAWGIWQSNVRPLVADTHSWRGTQALYRGNPQAAMVEYAAAIDGQPRRAAYHVALALTAAQLGRFEQADKAMDQAIALRPMDPVLYTQRAAIYAQGALKAPERIALANAAYAQALALAPTIGLTARHYADLALRIGDWPKASALAQRALDLDATDGAAYGILGWSQLQNGNLGEALDAFVQAVRWEPESADFHLGLAVAYFQQGDFLEARNAVQHSVRLDPTYEPDMTQQLLQNLQNK